MAAVIAVGRTRVIYVHDADLTLDGRVADPNVGFETVDVTTFDDDARRNVPGLQTNSFAYTGLYEDSVQRSYQTIKDMVNDKVARVVSVFMNGDGSGSVGYGLPNAYANLTFSGGPGEAEMVEGDFQQDGTKHSIVSIVAKGSVTADSTSGTYDRGAGATTTAGGAFYAHIFTNEASGLNTQWTIRLQHATTATGVYADVATLTVGSGTILGTAVEFTGTFNRFVRVVRDLDATSGTLEAQVSFTAH